MVTDSFGHDWAAERVVQLIERLRLPLGSETRMQRTLGRAFAGAGIDHAAEYRLGPRDRVDFLVSPDLAVECKLRANRREIYRQLCRYADHDAVGALLLVTNTAMGLPPEINGKPAYYVSLGKAWL